MEGVQKVQALSLLSLGCHQVSRTPLHRTMVSYAATNPKQQVSEPWVRPLKSQGKNNLSSSKAHSSLVLVKE